jgi:hypothetical protein
VMEAHLAKYRSLVPSLAMLCHLADVGHGPVGGEAMARAVLLGDFSKAMHAAPMTLYCALISRQRGRLAIGS